MYKIFTTASGLNDKFSHGGVCYETEEWTLFGQWRFCPTLPHLLYVSHNKLRIYTCVFSMDKSVYNYKKKRVFF